MFKRKKKSRVILLIILIFILLILVFSFLFEKRAIKINALEEKYLDRIKLGFREGVVSGIANGYVNSKYNPAAKTGTSESFIDTDGDGIVDKETMSNTFGAYAPYDNPKVSFVVVSPDIYYKETSTSRAPINKNITYRISSKYFEMYE